METPKFDHDCDRCIFLGRENDHDLYYCSNGWRPTLIARYGNGGPDYTSGLRLADYPWEVEIVRAKELAIEKGLL